MGIERDAVRDDVLGLLKQLADDWEYDEPITEATGLLNDMAMESLDLVVFATSLQEHFQQEMAFTEFLTELGQRAETDTTAGEWVDFVYHELQRAGQAAL
ncbi:MAG: hypothetical protein KDD73_09115 [Anaerolineales bacterium]|nr:hypothetical protein [Anaerolineales bacterium]MCB9129176.1 hypothetical protein [Ardenticatenales bacterium]